MADGRHLYAIGGYSDSGPLDIVQRFYSKGKVWHNVASTLEKRLGAGTTRTIRTIRTGRETMAYETVVQVVNCI